MTVTEFAFFCSVWFNTPLGLAFCFFPFSNTHTASGNWNRRVGFDRNRKGVLSKANNQYLQEKFDSATNCKLWYSSIYMYIYSCSRGTDLKPDSAWINEEDRDPPIQA